MTNICAQLKEHFPITHGEFLRYQPDFPIHSSWTFPIDDAFEPAYQRTRLPLDQRIVWKGSLCTIDGLISLPAPTFSNEAIEFWRGRKVVAILTAAMGGILVLITCIVAKSLAMLISSPLLRLGFVATSSALVVALLVFSALNLRAARETEERLSQWNKIKVHIPKLVQFPEQVARMRAEIFEAYRNGREVVGEMKNQLRRYIHPTERNALLAEGIRRAFPNATQNERIEKLVEKHDELFIHHGDPGNIWDYTFPQITVASLT